MKIQGRDFETVMGSDLERDGMFLELRESSGRTCAEVFYSDSTFQFTVTLFEPALPLDVLTWLINQARSRLPATTTVVDGRLQP